MLEGNSYDLQVTLQVTAVEHTWHGYASCKSRPGGVSSRTWLLHMAAYVLSSWSLHPDAATAEHHATVMQICPQNRGGTV